MESTLKITTTSDNKGVQEFVAWLNTADHSVTEYNKKLREMKNASVVGSQGQKDLKEVIGQVAEQTQTANGKMMSSYFKTGEALRSLAVQIGVAVAAYKTLQEAQEFAEVAARVEMLRSELQQLGDKNNFNATELINQMSDAAGGSVTQIDLMQIALKAVRLGNIDLAKMPDIMKQIEHDSKLAGLETREMFDLFIRGAETGSKKFQVQFGLLYDVKKAQEDYAKSIGTTSQNLSQEEQQAANVGAAFKALLARQSASNTEGEKTIERFERIKSTFENVKIKMGEMIGIPLSKFLLSIAYEAVILTDGLKSVYYILAGVINLFISAGKYAKLDFVGGANSLADAKKDMKELQNIGLDIRKQFSEMGNMWFDKDPAKLGTGTKIGGTPPPPKHVKTAEELAAELAIIKKRNEAEIKHDQEQQKALEWTDAALQKEASYIKDAQDAGLITEEQAIDELNTLVEMTVTEEERVKLLKEIKQLEDKSAKGEETEEKKEKARLKMLKEKYDQMGIMNKSVISGITSDFDNMAYQLGSAWQSMWARNIGNTQTLFAQLIQSIFDQFAALAARLAALQIISWIFPSLGGISGVANLFGGSPSISSPASSGYSSGTMSQLSKMTSGTGGSHIKLPPPQIIPIIEADRLSIMVTYGKQMKQGRVG